jgi:hypothetical protein
MVGLRELRDHIVLTPYSSIQSANLDMAVRLAILTNAELPPLPDPGLHEC